MSAQAPRFVPGDRVTYQGSEATVDSFDDDRDRYWLNIDDAGFEYVDRVDLEKSQPET